MNNKLITLRNIAIGVIICLSIGVFYYNRSILTNILFSIFLIFILSILFYFYRTAIKSNDSKEKVMDIIEQRLEDNIFNLVYPVVIIDNYGEITWNNNKFSELIEKNCLGKNIISIIRELDLSKLLLSERVLYQYIKINGKKYKIYSSKINNYNNQVKYMVYLNDISEIKDINSSESIMLIEVDNLAETLETTDDQDRPLLVAEIEREINAYAQKMKAMIIKYDATKYILSVQNFYIENEIQSKFEILDNISKIDKGNKLEVTLSIGIGSGGITSQENYNFATTAKELALGRGGDQVAVKNKDKITFFGGNSIEREKRTRVRARVIAHALKDIVYESKDIYIIGHKNPDMDCFGAAIGISAVIKQMGKKCNIILNNDTNAIEVYLQKLKATDSYKDLFINSQEAIRNISEKSLLIIVDVHNQGYIQDMEIVNKASRKIIIDHHRRSPDIITGTLLSYIEVYASSTSEMVTEIIQYMVKKPLLTALEAEGLLAGIFMDTKGFSFKTGVRTFDAAAFLRKLGADTIKVRNLFTDTLDDYLTIAEIIKEAKVENNLAISVAPKSTNDSVMIARAADELLGISGIKVCFILGYLDNDIIISGRSTGDINVQVILEALGGGGHMNMAGAKLTNETMEEAIILLKDSINKNLRVGE